MPTRLISFLISENLIIDKSDRFSIINIFNATVVDQLPAQAQLNLYLSVAADSGKYTISFTHRSPSHPEKEITSQTFEWDTPDKRDFGVITTWHFSEYGVHKFFAYINDQIIGENEIRVLSNEQAHV